MESGVLRKERSLGLLVHGFCLEELKEERERLREEPTKG